MKVILTREVKGLGRHDDIVNVSEGYARNFLFPRKMAIAATPANLAEVEKRLKAEESKGEKALAEAKEVADRLNETQVTVHGKVGQGTKLYGAVTASDIADAVEQQTGLKVDKRKIEIDEPIKAVGSYDVPVRLHREAIAHLKVEVVGD